MAVALDARITSDEKTLLSQIQTVGHKMDTLMYMDKKELLRKFAMRRGDDTSALGHSKDIISRLTKKALLAIPSDVQRQRALAILRTQYEYRGRFFFEDFLIAMEWKREPEKRFYEPRRRVLQEVVRDLQDLADGKIDIYGLSMPPRTGKTTLGLLYMCWLSGRNPSKGILSAGYSSSLVSSFYDGCKDFLTNEDYTFTSIFPTSNLVGTDAKYLTLDLHTHKRYKSLTFRSIDGSVTGATEASQLLYLDDLVSGIEEALNINRMETLWSKVTSDMLQRMKKGCKLLVIGTRWSIHDPIGRIEQKYADDSRARFKKLEAVDEEGHSNFDYGFDVGFDDKYYEDKKDILDPLTWECVFQQKPIERDGLLFPSLKRYIELPQDQPDDIFFFTDVAFGGQDYLSMPIAYQWGTDVYIADVVYMKGGYEVTQPIVSGKIISNACRRGIFEANNGGDFYSRDIAKIVKGKGHHCNILSLRAPTTQSKLSRIIQHAPAVSTFYFRDESLYKTDKMYREFMKALLGFVQTGKNKNDDAPDSCAGLASMLRTYNLQKVEFIDRKNLYL